MHATCVPRCLVIIPCGGRTVNAASMCRGRAPCWGLCSVFTCCGKEAAATLTGNPECQVPNARLVSGLVLQQPWHLPSNKQTHINTINNCCGRTCNATGWHTREAMEHACSHIVMPGTGMSSTGSRVAAMSHLVPPNARKPDVVIKPLAPSRVRRYREAVEDASSGWGSVARGYATASSECIVGAIPSSPERRWRSTEMTSEALALAQVPPVAVEPVSQRCCGFLTQVSPALAYRAVACS